MLRSRRLKTAREKPHGLMTRCWLARVVCLLFSGTLDSLLARRVNAWRSQQAVNASHGQSQQTVKGLGQKTLDEFICFWVPGATEHTESSVWGHVAASSEAFCDEVLCSVLFVFMFSCQCWPILQKPRNENCTMTLLRAVWASLSPTVQTLDGEMLSSVKDLQRHSHQLSLMLIS